MFAGREQNNLINKKRGVLYILCNLNIWIIDWTMWPVWIMWPIWTIDWITWPVIFLWKPTRVSLFSQVKVALLFWKTKTSLIDSLQRHLYRNFGGVWQYDCTVFSRLGVTRCHQTYLKSEHQFIRCLKVFDIKYSSPKFSGFK